MKGSIQDDELEVVDNAGMLIDNDQIVEVGVYAKLKEKARLHNYEMEVLEQDLVAFPGFVDAHTHICWAGTRSGDYAKRLAGKSYLEIANEGGGIWSTVLQTREATLEALSRTVSQHALVMLKQGITTAEVKSGYALSVDEELKMLWAIKSAYTSLDLIPTCLAAHICPKDFKGTNADYLQMISEKLLPLVKQESLARRVDIFVEDSAFSIEEARKYLEHAKSLGFDIVIHGDQFTAGGSALAVEMGALSVDHLEASNEEAIAKLAKSDVVATVLPGASLGLGIGFAPARKLLDSGACLSIASDWNPGSAPNGELLMQAAMLGVFEKLTIAETLSGITFRAAKALNLDDRGILKPGTLADVVAFPASDFREVVYRQGGLKPAAIWKRGVVLKV